MPSEYKPEKHINENIPVPEHIPSNIRAVLQDMEEHERNGQWWLYDVDCGDLGIFAKNAIAAGVMSRKDWEQILLRYGNNMD